jgi:hypothetical protein
MYSKNSMLTYSIARSWVFTFIFFCLLFLAPLVALAQNSTGIGIKPATIEETVTPGEVKTYSVEFTNLTPNQQIFYLFTRDIVGVADGGTPLFADENQEKTGFEITEWITLPVGELDLAGGESRAIDVTVNIPGNATPGSHFGAIFATLTPPRMRQSGAAVGYEVANIISLRVAGDAVENAQIRSFSTDNYIHGESKVDFRARVENKGTVLVRPTGPLEVYNMFGKRVALLTFNENKAGIFPFTTREFELHWEDEGPGFGRYQAILSLVYGDQGRKATISSTLSFWILPMNIIGPALGVLAVLLLGTYIAVKLYIRRSMAAVAGGRRLVRRRRGGGVSALLTIAVVMLGVTALFLIILLALFA